MKTIYYAITAAFSTFSIIPTPRINWERYSLRGILCALPLVGVVIGGLCYLYFMLADYLKLPEILSYCMLTILPVLISGGIHIDGFCDTVDALSSHADREKKRAILKDPHAGAFAIIGVCCLFLAYFGLCSAVSFTRKGMVLLGITHVIARAVGAFASVSIRSSKQEGMLAAFKDASSWASIVISVLWVLGCLAVCAYLSWIVCAVFAVTIICAYFFTTFIALHEFGGMSGDIAGYCITLSELFLLLGLVIAERIELCVW